MVTLKNVVTEIDGTFEKENDSKELETRKASYADLIKIAMNHPTQGNTVSQMRKDFRVIDVLDAAIKEKSETMSFEDADYDYMQSKVISNVWTFKHKGLFKLEDDINEAKK